MHHGNDKFTKQVIINTRRYEKIQYVEILEMFLKYPLYVDNNNPSNWWQMQRKSLLNMKR